ncbi:PP2C family protein-serine/threonine phosphatase [Microbacterium sp. RURRCA19A]|uniref:PP2C family protein-serine/threonine phosphatase n=1 Tax=Microbacterium sp. RURRCA19A TaxID=1907391 RepID=UPI0009540CF2|nr:PP2C family protein-serine/threonine phosphatase [Microbacterium sp. RURRCA19A]SIR74339.1 Serine phosphatase RsbU, regulator of sigma subunit [Microbacterium sp. RURRCA19A]
MRTDETGARAVVGSPGSLEAALDLLVAAAARGPGVEDTDRVALAERVVRDAVAELQATQSALTEALIASQDRQLAVEALARINLRGTASDDTLSLLLDRALSITDSRQVLLFEGHEVVLVRGDGGDLDAHVRLVHAALEAAPDDAVRAVASDTAVIGVLDPEGETEQHIAFFRSGDRPFSTADVPLIEAIVSAIGIMLAFRELHRHEFERAAVEREHQLASVLAQSVISTEPPPSTGVDVFAHTVPAALTGGDFYVFGRSTGAIWFAVGDVAGKGLPAAMLMTRAVAACRIAFLTRPDDSVVDVFQRIEDELFDHLDDVGVFITLAVGVIREDTGEVSLVNAGHSPVVFSGAEVEAVKASVPPLGVIRGRVPRVWTTVLGPDDTLVIGSDGLAEQTDPDGEQYGYDRFTDLCRSARGRSSTELGRIVFGAVDGFARGAAPSDDATLMVIRRGRTPA